MGVTINLDKMISFSLFVFIYFCSFDSAMFFFKLYVLANLFIVLCKTIAVNSICFLPNKKINP